MLFEAESVPYGDDIAVLRMLPVVYPGRKAVSLTGGTNYDH